MPRPRLAVERLELRDVPSAASAAPALQFLGNMHDEFNNRLPISDDVSSAGNHFLSVAKFPSSTAPVAVNGSWTADSPHSGATSIRNEFMPTQPFGGVYFQNGLLGADGKTLTNFGETPDAGVTIAGAARITFWARGQTGGEKIDLFAFGVGRDAFTGVPNAAMPDSSVRTPAAGGFTALTTDWRQYSIDLTGKDTSYVLGGFGWGADTAHNPTGAVFFLDDIQYELTAAGKLERGDEPRFVRSYLTGPQQMVNDPAGTFDFTLRNSAFSYDNALAALAFLADRDPATQSASLRHARLIGDAFVYAASNDRKYTDGRIRTDYTGGDETIPPGWVANGKLNTPPTAGFYDEVQQKFFEILQLNIDTGNNAWVMVSLLALHTRTGEASYLNAARRIGDFILTLRQDTGAYQGFLGGINNADHLTLLPSNRPYASTEHNIDVYAAFTRMFEITGEAKWQDGATHAWTFVEAMWNPATNLYRTGTSDSNTLNNTPGQVPLDVQVWATIANPSVRTTHPGLLATVEQTFGVTENGIAGYDFNDDKDGVWTEGTGQTGVAYAFAGDSAHALAIRRNLDLIRLNSTAPTAASPGLAVSDVFQRGLPAALHDGLTTGFLIEDGTQPFLYHNRLHIGATAWDAFAQLGFNPYYQTFADAQPLLPPLAVGGQTDGSVLPFAANPATGAYNTIPSAPLAPFGNIVANARTAVGDVNGDGVPDTIAVTGPGVPIRLAVVSGVDNTTLLVQPFDPFGGDFTGGGFVAAGDFDGDGQAEFVVSPDRGGGPRVSIFSLVNGGFAVRANFLGIDDATFRGGARVAIADINGDGTPDLGCAAGFLGGPRVALFDGATVFAAPMRLVGDFFGFPGSDAITLRNGAFLAIGDVDGDGFADVALGGGPGGAPRVFILSGKKLTGGDVAGAQAAPMANFFVANDANDRGGIRVATKDADRDGRADLAIGSGEASPAKARIYLGKNFTTTGEPGAFQDIALFGGTALDGGVFVG